MENKGAPIPKQPKITRRKFLEIAATGAAGAGALALGLSGGDPKKAVDWLTSPEPLSTTPINFGFNTHVRIKAGEHENLTLERFKVDVDLLREHNQTALRFNMRNGDVILGGDMNNIQWDEDSLRAYDEAISYAQERGMNIYFVTNVPEYAKDYSLEDYKKVTKLFYEELAYRYKGKIAHWQIFNEPDVHHYTDYHGISHMTDEYLKDFGEIVKTASETLEKVDPSAKTTVNASHWVGSGRPFRLDETRLFDAVKDSVDALTLDFYHDKNIDAIKEFPEEYIATYSEQYGKDIIIGELGLPTYGRFTADDQRRYVTHAIDAIKGGRIRPKAILLYELNDENAPDDQTNNVEKFFGFRFADGQTKPAFESVLRRMQPEGKTVKNATPLTESIMEWLERRFPFDRDR